MKELLIKTSFAALFMLAAFNATAQNGMPSKENVMNLKSAYVDKIDEVKIEKNGVTDYGMQSSLHKDQSATLQRAIKELSESGGGKLFIPKGTYLFRSVRMMSNVHIIFEEGTILKPYWGDESNVNMFDFSNDDKMSNIPIENCSIRASKGFYTVDYSNIPRNQEIRTRFVILKMVNNFSIADADIKDNYSVYCAFTLTPADAPNSLSWKVDRPTNGELTHCKIYNPNPGYGLVQIHGARNVYFEDIYSKGGVTLRLETGANTPTIGVYDIFARNVRNEDGRNAIMMNPHVAQNGTVKADGVWTKNSNVAVKAEGGPAGGKHGANSAAGRFGNDSKIINVHSIYGENSVASTKNLMNYHKEQYDLIKYLDVVPYGKWINSPSVAACIDETGDYWDITFENVTTEGFKYDNCDIIVREEGKGNGTEKNDQSMAIRESIPHLKKWHGYTKDDFFTPKKPVAADEVLKPQFKN
ncbi:MAG: glycosyl hydrolase family 28-related protein [Rikenellaceae bacterium]